MPVRPRQAARNRRAGFWRQWTLWIWFPLALFLVLAGVCLYRSGHWLVAGDPFGKVSWAVILAGESREGERSDAALKLYLEGRIDTLVQSSVRAFKDRYEAELSTGYLVGEGYPREKIFEFRHDAYSTQEEAALLIRQFRYQNLDTVLIITSSFHTARTRRIFRKLSQGYPQVLVYPAELKDFDPSAWWSGRESRKYWFIEWLKTVSTFFELLNAPPETGKSETDGLTGGSALPPADTLPPRPAPDTSGASADSIPDTSAAPGDTVASAVPAEDRDSVRAEADDSSPQLPAADSASASATAAKEPARAETARKETKSAAKEGPGAKEAATAKEAGGAKTSSSKSQAKSAGRKSPAKPSEKDKEKKKGSR